MANKYSYKEGTDPDDNLAMLEGDMRKYDLNSKAIKTMQAVIRAGNVKAVDTFFDELDYKQKFGLLLEIDFNILETNYETSTGRAVDLAYAMGQRNMGIHLNTLRWSLKKPVPQQDPEVVPQQDPEVVPQQDPVVVPQQEPEVVPQQEPEVVPQQDPVVVPQQDPVAVPQQDPVVVPQQDPVVVPQQEPEVSSTTRTRVPEGLLGLKDLLDSYLKTRNAVTDSSKKPKEYYCSFFSVFQKSLTQKTKAVEALQSALEGNSVALKEHLSTLRNGQLGKDLRQFIKAGKADVLVGKEVRTVSDFIEALEVNNANRSGPSKSNA